MIMTLSTSRLEATAFTFPAQDIPNDLPITAKRYTFDNSSENADGLTLILAHCVGAHKEQWEPTLLHLFESQNSLPRHSQIREAWSFDWQNHGDAAILNKDILEQRPTGISLYTWASALGSFARSSEHVLGHRIVLVGHSAGGTAMTLACRDVPNLVSLILIESVMLTRELWDEHLDARNTTMEFTVSSTLKRRDTWTDEKHAFDYLSTRFPWQTWDARVLNILTTEGMVSTREGITLKCDKRQEAASYNAVEVQFDGTERLSSEICAKVPVHLIWGEQESLVIDYIQDSLANASQGRKVASVRRVPDAGHFVVQENPDGLAESLIEVLKILPSAPSPSRSRL